MGNGIGYSIGPRAENVGFPKAVQAMGIAGEIIKEAEGTRNK